MIKLTTTTEAPKGKLVKIKKLIKKEVTEIMADEKITFLNLRKICIEDKAGKTIILEINKVPIMRMPITMVIAVKEANKTLNKRV